MHAAEIIIYLGRAGYTLDFVHELGIISIHPAPSLELAKRVLANEQQLLEYLRAMPTRPATNHAFFAPEDRKDTPEDTKRWGVCIRCGIGWAMHGEPPVEKWQYVTRKAIDELPLLDAWPVEVPKTATPIAESA